MRLLMTHAFLPVEQGIDVNSDTVTCISQDDVLYLGDTINPNRLNRILKNRGFPGTIISDCYSFFELPEVPLFVCFPVTLEREAITLRQGICTDEITTDHCVNFLINKKQIHRHILIKLVEHYKLDANYTWSGVDRHMDMSTINDEVKSLDRDTRLPPGYTYFFNEPITIEKKWIDFDNDGDNTNGRIDNCGDDTTWSWNNGINDIVSKSGVSLISESDSGSRFKGSTWSEKTVYATMGLTFPLWIGGFNSANEWKKMGFDAFDDVIDHSYQNKETVIERCWWAIHLNLDILTNKNLVHDLRLKHKDRLIQNRNLLMSNHITNHIDQLIDNAPKEIKLHAKNVVSCLRTHVKY